MEDELKPMQYNQVQELVDLIKGVTAIRYNGYLRPRNILKIVDTENKTCC